MIKKTILLCSTLLIAIVGFGQTDKPISKDKILELGYQNFRTFDKNVSPLIYSSNNGVIGFTFQNNKSDRRWSVGTTIAVGNNQSKSLGRREAISYDPYPVAGKRDSTIYDINPTISFLSASIQYSFHKQLKSSKKTMYLGGTVQNTFFYGALGADVWFFNQLSIMPSYQINLFKNSASELNAQVSIPILSYLVRQPYTLDPSLPEESYFKAYLQTGSSVTSLHEFQQLHLNMTYRYTLSSGKKVGISYYFMWMNHTNIPDRNLKAYSNTLSISYIF